jgi:hypothetical protein
MRLKRAIMLACVGVVACDWPGVVCGCVRPDVDYTMRGFVQTASGQPVSGASIAASTIPTTCATVASPYTFSPLPSTTSGSDGAFTVTFREFGNICLRLTVKRPVEADSVVVKLDLSPSRLSATETIRFP